MKVGMLIVNKDSGEVTIFPKTEYSIIPYEGQVITLSDNISGYVEYIVVSRKTSYECKVHIYNALCKKCKNEHVTIILNVKQINTKDYEI